VQTSGNLELEVPVNGIKPFMVGSACRREIPGFCLNRKAAGRFIDEVIPAALCNFKIYL